MSGGHGKAVVLVFGEDRHDAASIAALLEAGNPKLQGRVRARPRPTSLTREAKHPAVRNWVQELGDVIRATVAAGTSVAAVVVHRDADRPDPDGAVAADLTGQLSPIGGHPAVPVQAIEAWWLLFPDAVEAVRPRAWAGKLPRKRRDVETVVNPKKELQRLTGTGRASRYEEADSISIAENIKRVKPRRYGSSASYDRLLQLAGTLL